MKKRIHILYEIDNHINDYCSVCPFTGRDILEHNCHTCPIGFNLRDLGELLKIKEDVPIKRINSLWTTEDQAYIMHHEGMMCHDDIGEGIGRTGEAVKKQLQKLKREGKHVGGVVNHAIR